MKECPNCSSEYKSLGHHYARSSCDYPNIDGEIREVLVGILMGDGCISHTNKNPYMRVEMTNKEFLEQLESTYPHIFGSVRIHQTAKERSTRDRKSGWNKGAMEENYSDIYVVQTYSNPALRELHSWYSDSGKSFPKTELTSTSLKYWYCCDGNLSEYGNFRIGCSNEIDNKEKIRYMFRKIPVSVRFGNNQIWFTKSDSEVLYDYIGQPVKGFKYKWPEYANGEKE